MREKLKHRQKIPHGGKWIARYPATGQLFISEVSFDDLVDQLTAYCKANGFGIGLGFEDEVESWVCKELPKACEPDTSGMPIGRRKLHMDDIVRGLQSLSGVMGAQLLSWFGGKSPFVDQAEANRRASICAKCGYNIAFKKPCAGICPELKTLVELIRGHRSTPYDNRLDSCSICGCFNSVTVWIELPIQERALTNEMKELFSAIGWCWKKP